MNLDDARDELLRRTQPPADLDALLRRVEADVQRERGALAWLRSRPTWLRRALLVAAALIVPGYVLVAFGLRPDLASYPRLRMGALVAAFSGLAAWAFALATRPLHRAPARVGAGATVALAAVAVLVAVALPQADPLAAPAPLHAAELCYLWGLLMGAPLVVAALLVARERTAPRAAAFAAAAGLIANLALQVHCGATDRAHLLLGHATIVFTWLAAALVLGRSRR